MIDKDRGSPGQTDGFGRGEKCIGRYDHLIAPADLERHQADMQCRRAGIDAGTKTGLVRGGEMLFKGLDKRTRGKCTPIQHLLNGIIDLRLDALVLAFKSRKFFIFLLAIG